MLRGLTILNYVESINQRKILTEMDKIGSGAPRIIWKVNLMECTLTIHPTSMLNGTNKNIGRDNTIKGQVLA